MDQDGLVITVRGAKGGHSGLNIIENRANAIKVITRVLTRAFRDLDVSVADIEGGNKHNAIPREARATVVLPSDAVDAFRKTLHAEFEALRAEYRPAEPGMELGVEDTEVPAQVWDSETTEHDVAGTPYKTDVVKQYADGDPWSRWVMGVLLIFRIG